MITSYSRFFLNLLLIVISVIKHVRVSVTRVCAHLHLSVLHGKLKIIQPSHCEFTTITIWHVLVT